MAAVVVVLLLLGHLTPIAFASYDIDEDVWLDTPGLLKKYGYPTETHRVTTKDGYILTIHRVPYSPLSPLQEGVKKPVIFLQHGLVSSSSDWVVMGPGSGFAYLLADAGYDVWMGNFRGNRYSRAHKSLDPNDSQFWQFSWHESGIYDLPTMIDYTLAQTGQEKLYYIGYSMGVTTFFVMASRKPEYNDKVYYMFAMAPIAYMNHMFSPFLHLLASFEVPFSILLSMLGVNELQPTNVLMNIGGELLCRDGAISQSICSNVLFLIAGYDSVELNETMLPVIFAHSPAGASTRQVLHYAQLIVSGKFCEYDYGHSNIFHYGSLTPPKYELRAITAPVVLQYSDNDWLVSPYDVRRVYKELKNPVGDWGQFKLPFEKFNHLDYLYAIHAKEYVYDTIMDLMECNENPTAECQKRLTRR